MKHILITILIISGIHVYSQNDEWNISTTDNSNYTGIVVANGRIGILPSKHLFKTEQIILNNVYDKESPLGVSRILLGMNFQNIQIEINGEEIEEDHISNWSQRLDMKKAAFTTQFTYKNKAHISYTMYALRNVPYAGYLDVTIKAKENINVKVIASIETPEEYQNPTSTFRILRDLETTVIMII